MRKATFILTVLLAIAAFPAFAQFDNYHYNANMNCSDCHSMHASAHNNLTDGSEIETSNTTGGTAINPYYPNQPANGRHYLLKNTDVCASCHDGQTWAPDVIGDNFNSYVRSAGGVKADTTVTTGGGHQIGSTVRPPGYNGTPVNNYFAAGSQLECFSCHSPHGGTAFRNLGPYQMRTTIGMAAAANVLPTVTKSTTFSNTTDVTINAATRTWGTDLPGYYANQNVKYGRNATGVTFGGVVASNRYDHFCGVCHGQFHGGAITETTVGDGTGFIKHPTSVVQISGASTSVWGAQNGAQTLKVYTPDGAQGYDSSPGCVTCHKAHGNNNPFALIYPDRQTGTASGEEGGTGKVYKDLCKSCHSMGGV